MPCCASSAPRKKLPPPMTTATWTPERATSATCRATSATTSGSTPRLPPPKTSPESLRTTRLYGRRSDADNDEAATAEVSVILPSTVTASLVLGVNLPSGTDAEACEPVDGRTLGLEDRLHGLLLVLRGGLLEQDVV